MPITRKRFQRVSAFVLLVVVATGCTRARVNVAPTGTASPRPPSVEVIGENITIFPGAERAVRFGFVSDDPSARLIVTFPDTNSIVAACLVANFKAAIPEKLQAPSCREEVPSGVREDLSSPQNVAGIAIWVRRGNAVTVGIRLEYAEGARPRPLRISLPNVAAPTDATRCKDNGCNPVFEVRPVRGGNFTATARWTGGPARLALLQGRVLAKSFTATGVPYAVAAQQTGSTAASIATRMSAPAEYALIVDSNTQNVENIDIEASWP